MESAAPASPTTWPELGERDVVLLERADLTSGSPFHSAGLVGILFCREDKPGGFLGTAALRTARVDGPIRRLACLILNDPRAVAVGSEPVRAADGRVIGRIASAGYGYPVGASIAYAYLPVADAEPGTPVSVDLFGRWVHGVVADDVLYDPTNARIRA